MASNLEKISLLENQPSLRPTPTHSLIAHYGRLPHSQNSLNVSKSNDFTNPLSDAGSLINQMKQVIQFTLKSANFYSFLPQTFLTSPRSFGNSRFTVSGTAKIIVPQKKRNAAINDIVTIG